MKLKAKMAWIIACSVLLTLILMTTMIVGFNSWFVSGYNHARLQEMSERLAGRLEQAMARNEEPFTQVLQEFGRQYEGVGTELFDSAGTLLYSSVNRSRPYTLPEMMARFTDQPGRMFQGQDSAFLFDIDANGKRFFVVFDVQGNTFQQVQLFLYLNQYSALPFLLAPLILIIALPSLIAVLFLLFVTRRLDRLNGAMRHADLRKEPVRLQDRSGDEIGALTRLFNEMSDKLYRQYLHTQRIEQARAKLISNLSHDLRTPLSIIHGYAETLQRGSSQVPEIRVRHATIILQKSEYMNGLLGRLFRLAEIDDPSISFHTERSSTHYLLQSIVSEYVLLLEDYGFKWEADLPETIVYLDYDRESIAQALRNLIDNAILHGRDGKYLGIRLIVDTDEVRIEVEDRGKGIPPDELGRIFDRFYRVDKGRQSNGMGIGLSLCNEIALRHGGRITVRSVPNISTVFTVHLPFNALASDSLTS
jgi:Signal transduction histidine kinase